MSQDKLNSVRDDLDAAMDILYEATDKMLSELRRGVELGRIEKAQFDQDEDINKLKTREAYNYIVKQSAIIIAYFHQNKPDNINDDVWEMGIRKLKELTRVAHDSASVIIGQYDMAVAYNNDDVYHPDEQIREAAEKAPPKQQPSPAAVDPFVAAKKRMNNNIRPEDLN